MPCREHYGRGVSARNVRFLAEERLRPLGVLALRDGTTPELPKREALFALRCRTPLLPERAVNAIARALTWLHWPPVKLPSSQRWRSSTSGCSRSTASRRRCAA